MTIPASYTRKAPPQQPTAPVHRPSGGTHTTPIINPYVKTGNIKKSFVALTKEAEKYRDATKQAQEERDSLLQRLTVAQQRNKDLLQELRIAQDNKGTLHRQVQLWENQHKNLERHIAKERQTSQQLTDDLAAAAHKLQQERVGHLLKINVLNTTLKQLLQQATEERYEALLHPHVVDDLGGVIAHHNSPLATRDTHNALQAMGKSGTAYYATINQAQMLWEQIQDWRRHLQGDNGDTTTQDKWTDQELDKLEDEWNNGSASNFLSSPSVSVQLFADSPTAKHANHNEAIMDQDDPLSVSMEVEGVIAKDPQEPDDEMTTGEVFDKIAESPSSPSSPDSMEIEKVITQDVDQAVKMVTTEHDDEVESPSTSLLPPETEDMGTSTPKDREENESDVVLTENTPQKDLDMDGKNED